MRCSNLRSNRLRRRPGRTLRPAGPPPTSPDAGPCSSVPCPPPNVEALPPRATRRARGSACLQPFADSTLGELGMARMKLREPRARTSPARAITRREAKALTRERLVAAARRLILAGGETRLAASRVAREAGVAGATFYEHFESLDELMQALAKDLFDELRRELGVRRREALEAPDDES